VVPALVLPVAGWLRPPPATAAEPIPHPDAARIRALEDLIEDLGGRIEALQREVEALKQGRSEPAPAAPAEPPAPPSPPPHEAAAAPTAPEPRAPWFERFTLGGYGEMHANFEQGSASDQFDIHRLVLYLGYEFADWIRFHSETELEHAFVSHDGDGELSLEQAYVDFLLSDPLNVRVGRILTPLGITNRKHEPPAFNGVERPSFDRVIIPTTWSSDGAGVFGSLTRALKYEAYVVGGIDGSRFDALNGIRNGRIKGSPGLNDPAVTGRLDYYPFAARPAGLGQTLRLGLSAYAGGLDNGAEGEKPGIDGDIRILSGDFEYSLSRFDFRGALAHEDIDGALEIGNGTASEIPGWYLEAAAHLWPDAWKSGKLATADAVAFLRYDRFDTQYEMPPGIAPDPRGDRDEWTFGLAFYPSPAFVIKADYQLREDAAPGHPSDLFNLGVGWQF